jgi:hypothetical protein
VDVQHQRVVEVQEQVLSVRLGREQAMPVQQRRSPAEPALGAGNGERVTREDVAELAGEPADGMALRHYSMTSPVAS